MSNVYAFPVDGITVPCFVFGYPEQMTVKTTFQRGSDEAVYPVWFVIGQGATSTVDVRNQLSAAWDGAGDVITALDGNHAFGAVDTRDPKIEPVSVGGVGYIAIRFDCYVMSSGAMSMSAVMDGLAALITTAGL